MLRKILIIGKGSISYRHKAILKNLFKNLKIVHIGSRFFFKNLSKFKNQKFEITIIANDSSSHIKTLNFIHKNSKFIFIEKPISNNFLYVKNFFKINKINLSKIWVGYNFLFSKTFIYLKNKIENSHYGELISVRSTVGQNVKFWRKKNYLKSVSVSKKLGGGILNELSHEIHYLIELFGNLKIINKNISKSYFKEIDVADSAFILFKNKKNITISLIMDFYRNDKFRQCHLIFEKATLIVDFINGKIFLRKKNIENKTIFSAKNDIENSYVRQWRYIKKLIDKQYGDKKNYKTALLTMKTIYRLNK